MLLSVVILFSSLIVQNTVAADNFYAYHTKVQHSATDFFGKYADIMVGSFGRWKPVNAGKGGFISFSTKEMFECASSFLHKPDIPNLEVQSIKNGLANVKKRLSFLYNV